MGGLLVCVSVPAPAPPTVRAVNVDVDVEDVNVGNVGNPVGVDSHISDIVDEE